MALVLGARLISLPSSTLPNYSTMFSHIIGLCADGVFWGMLVLFEIVSSERVLAIEYV